MKYGSTQNIYPFFLVVFNKHDRNGGCITPDDAPALAGRYLLEVCRAADRLRAELGGGWSITSVYTPGGVASGAWPWQSYDEYESQGALFPDIPEKVLKDVQHAVDCSMVVQFQIDSGSNRYIIKYDNPWGDWKTY